MNRFLRMRFSRIGILCFSICALILSFILLAALFSQNKQEFSSTNLSQGKETFDLRVLTVGINPIENGQALVPRFWGRNARDIETDAFQRAIDAFGRLSGNTIRYSIVHRVEINTFPILPDGSQIFDMTSYASCLSGNGQNCDAKKYAFSYTKFFEDNNICGLARQYNVDEIWLMTPPYIGIYESLMIGPTEGYWINGGVEVSSTCQKQYFVMGPTYDRPETVLHNFSHRFESNIEYLFSNMQTDETNNHWRRFSGFENQPRNCGNGHFPKNARFDYDYGNTATSSFNCVDWQNFPNYTGVTANIGCSAWGCDDPGWQEYWFKYIPHSSGMTTIKNKNGADVPIFKNWWNYLLDAELSMTFVAQSANLQPTTPAPTTAVPTTQVPTTIFPTTILPTTIIPTVIPTTAVPTTIAPTTIIPSTVTPSVSATTTSSVTPSVSVLPTPVACLEYTFSIWSSCQNGVQTREIESKSPYNCIQDENITLQKSCTNETLSCTDIEYDWSECIDNIQTRRVKSKSPDTCVLQDETFTRACNTGFVTSVAPTESQKEGEENGVEGSLDISTRNIVIVVVIVSFVGGVVGIIYVFRMK